MFAFPNIPLSPPSYPDRAACAVPNDLCILSIGTSSVVVMLIIVAIIVMILESRVTT
jgi:hypothetical protein